jgi:small conductance mechanosensitive channel
MIDGFLQVTDWGAASAAAGLVLGLAYLGAWMAGRLGHVAFRRLGGVEAQGVDSPPAVLRPIRIIRAFVFAAIAIGLGIPALRIAGVRPVPGPRPEIVGIWLLQSGLRMTFIAVGAYVLTRLVAVVAQRFEAEVTRGGGPDVLERAKRARTLGSLVENVAGALVVGIAILMILRELDVDVLPVLTGAGILGLAVGFGAQTLVKDVIAGFFLILENQIRVGDVAVINGTAGTIEAINLRTVILRDAEGAVHIFPNGSVASLSNRSRDFAYAVVDLRVPFRADLDALAAALLEIGEALRLDPQYRTSVLEPLEVLGVDTLDPSVVTLKLRLKTVPFKQVEVARELRRRIKTLVERLDLAVPMPAVSFQFGEGPR